MKPAVHWRRPVRSEAITDIELRMPHKCFALHFLVGVDSLAAVGEFRLPSALMPAISSETFPRLVGPLGQ